MTETWGIWSLVQVQVSVAPPPDISPETEWSIEPSDQENFQLLG